MATKTFAATTVGSSAGFEDAPFAVIVKVTSTANESTNSSTINWTATFQCSGGGHYNYTNGNYLKIVMNGTAVYDANPGAMNISTNGSKQLASGSFTVAHNSDGTKSFTVDITFTQSQESSFNMSNSSDSVADRTFTCDKINVVINGYHPSTVYVNTTGSTWKGATAYVNTGSSWEKMDVPYIKIE